MVNTVARAAALMGALLLSACQGTPLDTAAAPVPALLDQPDAQTRAELREAVLALTGFSSVTLADEDLTRSSTLVIERKHQRDGKGDLLQGRDLEMPQYLRLELRGGQCWLQHLGRDQGRALKSARCKANSS